MDNLKHLKTFENFSMEIVNEESLFKSKIKSKFGDFKNKYKSEFEKLKKAEKKGGEELKEIQDFLMSKVKEEWKELGKGLSGEKKNLLRQDLKTEILNVDASDKRSLAQKLGSGMQSGK